MVYRETDYVMCYRRRKQHEKVKFYREIIEHEKMLNFWVYLELSY